MWSMSRQVFCTLLVVALLVMGGAAAFGQTYDRSETLYTQGSAWGPPSDWNPVTNWEFATGTLGLCYETLFQYNPLTDEMIPWLAESGEWKSSNVYELKIREGMTWQDGTPITAADVQFTFELGQKFDTVYYSGMWDHLDYITQVGDYYLELSFSDPLYHRFENRLYSIAILPQHIWEDYTEEQVTSGANENPVGSGAYMYESHGQDRMVWIRNDNWWGTELLDLVPAPKRIVDIVNSSNNVSLGMLLKGELDLCNNFLPGIKQIVNGGYGIETYYPDTPYMLPADVACLWLNLRTSPMDDAAFRKAVAHAIDVDEIVNVVYGGIVAKANPVGLLPLEGKINYLDEDVVAEHGFGYDPAKAAQLLADAGYVDVDGDGFVETPAGEPIELTIIVPFGWTDWMESINVISRGCQAVGINLQTEFPDYGGYWNQFTTGAFDMAINNFGSAVSNSVWTYFNWLFRSPLRDQMNDGNFGHYDNQDAFDLVVELDKTLPSDTAGMQAVLSQLQEILLTDLPVIPLWYNGAWSQVYTGVWGNFPSAAADTPDFYSVTWGGYWQMGGLLTLTGLELQE